MAKTTNAQMKAISANLKEIRRKNGWLQTDLAKRMGTSQNLVSAYENCKKNMLVSSAQKYAKNLGMTYSAFTSAPVIGSGKETGISPNAYQEPKAKKKSKPTKQHHIPAVPEWCSKEKSEKLEESGKPIEDMTIGELQDLENAISLKQGKLPRKVEVQFIPVEELKKRAAESSAPETAESAKSETAESKESEKPKEFSDPITISITISGMDSLKELLSLFPWNSLK